ncbi:MAG: Zn-dependent hydrolase [Candidatus Thorarchaeota archaeon]|nr:MAG: Zn-dependent hydrolase [Candidatus Thorarchaeota archaeon]
MSSSRTGTRGILVSFDEPFFTNVYIIFGNEHVFVLDTFLGNDPMKIVRHLIEDEGCASMPLIIFNSHADYDHYWGNGAFKDASIVGHEHCRQRIISEGEASLVKYANHVRGKVELLPPTRTFQEALRYEDEEVAFFHTPGHTLDSSSCFDDKDRILFVGDNVESPIPYLNHANFEEYIRSLESYLELDWKLIIAGHDPPLRESHLIKRNIDYLRKFKDWSIDLGALSSSELHRHIHDNLKTIRAELIRSKDRQAAMKHLEEAREYTTLKTLRP